MRPTDNIEEVISKLNLKPSAALGRRTIRDAIAAQTNCADPAHSHISTWRNIMNSKITKLAIAAVIIFVAGILLYRQTGSIDGTTASYAKMIENVMKAHSVCFKQTFVHKDGHRLSNIVKVNHAGVKRVEIPGGMVLLFYPGKDFTITLWTNERRAFITKRQGMKNPQCNMLDFIVNQKNFGNEYKGRQVIDGQSTDLYITESRNGKHMIWIDPVTEFPVRTEQIEYKDPNRIYPHIELAVKDFGGDSGQNGAFDAEPFDTIYSDFQWNIELDESLFSENVPTDYNITDYNITETVINVAEPNENHFVEAVKFWAQYHQGPIEPRIEVICDSNELKLMLIDKFDRDEDPEKEYYAAFACARTVLKGLEFAQQKKDKSNWFYNEGVQLGDFNTAVCWWKIEDANTYRVIYGDLSIHDVNDIP